MCYLRCYYIAYILHGCCYNLQYNPATTAVYKNLKFNHTLTKGLLCCLVVSCQRSLLRASDGVTAIVTGLPGSVATIGFPRSLSPCWPINEMLASWATSFCRCIPGCMPLGGRGMLAPRACGRGWDGWVTIFSWGRAVPLCPAADACNTPIGRVSYITIYLCYFCFRLKTVSLVQASMQHLMHHVTVSLQQSKITLQNNCTNNTSITQPTLTFNLWLKI